MFKRQFFSKLLIRNLNVTSLWGISYYYNIVKNSHFYVCSTKKFIIVVKKVIPFDGKNDLVDTRPGQPGRHWSHWLFNNFWKNLEKSWNFETRLEIFKSPLFQTLHYNFIIFRCYKKRKNRRKCKKIEKRQISDKIQELKEKKRKIQLEKLTELEGIKEVVIIITELFFTFIQILLENLQFNNLSLKSRFRCNRMS